MSASPPSAAGCVDAYQGQGQGGIATYQIAPNGIAFRARLLLVFAVPSEFATPLLAGEEYFVARILVSNAKTTGTGSCAGCATGACMRAEYVRIVQVPGAPGGNVTVYMPDQNHYTSWQTAQAFENDCGFTCTEPGKPSLSSCAICPAQNVTWGRIKAIYR